MMSVSFMACDVVSVFGRLRNLVAICLSADISVFLSHFLFSTIRLHAY